MNAYSAQLVCPRCNTTIRVQGTGPGSRGMDPAAAEACVRGFVEALSSQARFGLRGEKPLAVIAALKYLCESALTGVGLSAMLENEASAQAIRSRFVALENLYGRSPNPERSWTVMTGGDRFELQTAARSSPDLDRSVSSLTPEQACSLSREFVQDLAGTPGPMSHVPDSDGGQAVNRKVNPG